MLHEVCSSENCPISVHLSRVSGGSPAGKRVVWDIGGSVPTTMSLLTVLHCFQEQGMDSSKEIPVLDLLMAFVNYHMRLFLGRLENQGEETRVPWKQRAELRTEVQVKGTQRLCFRITLCGSSGMSQTVQQEWETQSHTTICSSLRNSVRRIPLKGSWASQPYHWEEFLGKSVGSNIEAR